MKRSSSAGFTLIELLVVIAIIALLAGIALPVFGRVQEKARATKDANSLRQLGISMVSYLNDNNDQMFAKSPTGGDAATPTSWPAILVAGKYMPDTRTFQSPFDRRVTGADVTKYNVSYGVNLNTWSEKVTSLSKWVAPSRTILIAPIPTADAAISTSWSGQSDTQPERTLPAAAPTLGTHNSGQSINALFGDSHIETLTWKVFSKTGADQALWFPLQTGT